MPRLINAIVTVAITAFVILAASPSHLGMLVIPATAEVIALVMPNLLVLAVARGSFARADELLRRVEGKWFFYPLWSFEGLLIAVGAFEHLWPGYGASAGMEWFLAYVIATYTAPDLSQRIESRFARRAA